MYPKSLRLFAVILALMVVVSPAMAQPEPQREQLLNGLRILFWEKPGSPDVLVKLRIHSGAAFDLAGKSGEMALLGDLLFPDSATKDFFSDEMGGKFDIAVNYDSITITMVGKAAQFDQIIEVLRNGLLATQLTPDVINRMREARLKILRETAISPATVADRAISSRLFGDFPYGRPAGGTTEDVARVDRADLMLARERFLNSNNATLAIVGGVQVPRALRTLRQLLGPWRKSEQIVPTSFRQPIPADTRTLILSGPGSSAEVRLAVRGVSRSDADYFATAVLAKLAQVRWQSLYPDLVNKPVSVRSESHVLPGIIVMGATVNAQNATDALLTGRKTLESVVANLATISEMDRARSEAIAEMAGPLARPEAAPDPWLDSDTFRLKEVQNDVISLQAVTPADVQRVATRLLSNPSIATVVVGDPLQLKPALQGRISFEVFGEVVAPPPDTTPKTPIKPGTNAKPS
jgi:zinc protease